MKNEGEVRKYYVEESHEAIIDSEVWECAQLEMKRRKEYMEEYGLSTYSHNTENNPFASEVICGSCNKAFARKGWKSGDEYRRVWQCSERYKRKGIVGCNNHHVEESTLEKAFVMAWNLMIENKEHLIEKWKRIILEDDLLLGYRAKSLLNKVEEIGPIKRMDLDFMLETMDHIKIFEDGLIQVVFYDGSKMECKNEE